MPTLSITTSSKKEIIIDDCFIEYMNYISDLLGIDVKYEDFSKMSDGERLSYFRDLKIKKVLKEID